MSDYYQTCREMFAKYYPNIPGYHQHSKALRCACHLKLIAENISDRHGKVCDLGGNFGNLAAVCAALGMDATFIDDFGEPCHAEASDFRFRIHEEYGAKAIQRDLIKDGIDFPDESIDAFTCFATMEHWHHSPKKLFHQVMRALRPRGLFILSAPNGLDLWKRITVPLGASSWSTMASWYEQPVFRNHVREPSLKDMRYIARDMGLREVKLFGRNWSPYQSRSAVLRAVAPAVDRILRCRPSLCLSVYMMGRK